MKKKISIALCVILTAVSLAGCGSQKNSDDATGTNVEDSTKDNNIQNDDTENEIKKNDTGEVLATEVKIWHDGDEAIMQTIADYVNKQLADEQITVAFEKKAGLTDQMQLYGNDEVNGPDMYLYAHDSLGAFVEMGILAPIKDLVNKNVLSDLLPMTIEAGQYKGEQYLLPVYYETLLFLYNTDLWEGEIPTTTDELYEYMTAHTDTETGTYAVVNQHSTAYNVAPYINGYGGYILNEDAQPGLNMEETKEAIAYNKKFAQLQADGDYNTVTALFNEGKAAAIIGGPWLISGIQDAGINYGIKSLAEFTLPNGNALAPYSGVQGIGVMKYSAEKKADAISKVLEAIVSPEVGIMLANEFNCAPSNSKAYDDANVAENEMIMAMKETAKTAQPMPNIPEMSVMWGPAEQLLAAVNKSDEDVDIAAEVYQEQALTAIADMQ